MVSSSTHMTLKALLIQALKKEMPTALLFTTDLDARMGDSNQIKWTRNLLVASGFGLQLHPELQGPVAPFRDNYQTGGTELLQYALVSMP